MGISDDIKPKRGHHTASHRHTDHDFLDDFDYEGIVGDTVPPKDREDSKHREALEDDFFSKKLASKRDDYKDYYESYHNKDKDNKEEDEGDEPAGHLSGAKRKKHGGGNLARTLIWIMTLAIIVLLLWQNKAEIIKLIKEKVFNETAITSPIESKKTDDYYTSETSNTNENINVNANLNTNTAPAAAAMLSPADYASVKIEILNGNGIKNSGATAKATLESGGFTVAKTANAKNFNYATTLIYYKTGQDAEANAVKTALIGKDVTIENNDTLVGEYDVVIVLGAK